MLHYLTQRYLRRPMQALLDRLNRQKWVVAEYLGPDKGWKAVHVCETAPEALALLPQAAKGSYMFSVLRQETMDVQNRLIASRVYHNRARDLYDGPK